MSLSRTTRKALGNMSQSSFADWLAEQTGGKHMPQSQVSRYDCGVNQMNRAQVSACSPVAAKWLAEQTRSMSVEEAAKLILDALQ